MGHGQGKKIFVAIFTPLLLNCTVLYFQSSNNYLDFLAMVTIIPLLSLFVILTYFNFSYVASSEISAAKPNLIKCHDPAYGGNPAARKVADKRFVMVGGNGFGVGNFLVFFPAAYYFAALTGRVSFTKIRFVDILFNFIENCFCRKF
jgi:hypothetical protein